MRLYLSIILLFILGSFAAAQTRIKPIDAILDELHKESDFSGNVKSLSNSTLNLWL